MKYQLTVLIILTLLILTGSFTVSYAIINFNPDDYITQVNTPNDDKNKNDDPNKVDLENHPSQKYPTEIENSIDRQYTFTLNEKEVVLPITFTSTVQSIKDERYRTIEGKFKNNVIYSMSEIKDVNTIKQDPLTHSKVSSALKDDKFKIIKGQDGKEYLAIITNFIPLENGIEYIQNLYILNDQLTLIYDSNKEESLSKKEYFTIVTGNVGTINSVEGTSPWYKDTFKSCNPNETCNVKLKIEDDKIYYLMTEDYKTLEERVYTIEDDKLQYETLKTYKITDVSNLPA